MSALTDLQAADTAVGTASAAVTAAVGSAQLIIQSAITLIQGFQAGTVNADDAAVEQVVSDLDTASIGLTSSAGSLASASGALSTATAPVLTVTATPSLTTSTTPSSAGPAKPVA